MKKAHRKLIPAVAMLLVSAIMLSTASFAWFSMNTEVNVTGMSVKSTSSESLVISNSHAVTSEVSVSKEAHGTALIPITYKDNTYKYCNNGADVDPKTGLALEHKTLTFTEVPEEGAGYYVDYVVYLAAAGAPMTGKDLTATVTFGSATLTQQAVAVGFTVLSEASEDVSAQAVATKPAKTVHADQTEDDLTVTIAENQAFPLNTTNKSIPVLMRIYFDGAYLGSDGLGNALVNSAEINTAALKIDVNFSVTAHPQDGG